jgi:hypothetical protein
MINIQPIKDDWINQRCKPYVIPFAGLVNAPKGTSINDFTKKNFEYCTQDILKNITGDAVQPLTYVTKSLYFLYNTIKESLNASRSMFNKIRNLFQEIVKEIMGRLLNIMVPLQQIVISFKDIISKVQGVMTAGLFTLLGSYYALKSLLGAIAQFIITILIALVVIIAMFWIFPFTWGAAIANTAIFVAISIPMALMLAFMVDVLKVNPNLSIPQLKVPSVKCFDKNTKFVMEDGTIKTIYNLNVGDILLDGNKITAKFKVETNGSIMYNLYDIIVSDSHYVKYNNKWIKVCEHPYAIKITNYNEKYLYCLNTSSKIIILNNIIFSDWDEIFEDDIITLKLLLKHNKNIKSQDYKNNLIHKFFDGGFTEDTSIKLINDSSKKIKDIKIGDVLQHNEKVYGIVEIDGIDLDGQYIYNLGNGLIRGGPNINFCDRRIKYTSTINCINKQINETKDNKLYHLLTDKKTFYVNNYKVYDYNASIDLLLDKNKGKLLSMKYV